MKTPCDAGCRCGCHGGCGCCAGIRKTTPAGIYNRHGLESLRYRVGTHDGFLQSMKAAIAGTTELEGLKTRSSDDFSLALMDGAAVVCDVLSFYQERIANEGYLRTATERRSVLELARLVGYVLRPGVAASAYLAFSLQKDFVTSIPPGTAVKSIPGQNELPETFETSTGIEARAAWNEMRPRPTRPQNITPDNAANLGQIYFEGVATQLKPNGLLLFVFSNPQSLGVPNVWVVRRIAEVIEEPQAKHTRVLLLTEAFSSTAFANRVQLALARLQVGDCSILSSLPSVVAFQAAIKPSLPLQKLDEQTQKFFADLGGEAGGSETAVADLKSLATIAGNIAGALEAEVLAPDAVLAGEAAAVIADFLGQQAHASTMEDALESFATSVKDGESVRMQIDKWDTAIAAVAAAADSLTDFVALAKRAGKQRTSWQAPHTSLVKALSDAATAADPLLDDAITLAVGTLKASLTTHRAALKAALAGTPGELADEIIALQALLDATVVVAGTLKDKLDKIQKALEKGLDAAGVNIAKAITRMEEDLHQPDSAELLAGVQTSLQDFSTALDTTPRRMSGSVLAAEREDISTAASEAGNTFPLLKTRFQEVIKQLDALKKSAGATAAFLAALAANPVSPAGFPQGSPQAIRATQLAGIVDNLKQKLTPGAFPPIVAAADAARGAFVAARTSIDKQADVLAGVKECAAKLNKDLTSIRRDFGALFRKSLLTATEQQEKRVPADDPGRQKAVAAIDRLKKLVEDCKNKTLAEQLALFAVARADIDALDDATASPALLLWFQGVKAEIDALAKKVTSAAAPPVENPAVFADAVSHLDSVAQSLKAGNTQPQKTLSLTEAFAEGSDALPRALIAMNSKIGEGLYQGWVNQAVGAPLQVEVFAFRAKASLFGHNSPGKPPLQKRSLDGLTFELESPVDYPVVAEPHAIHLEMANEAILDDSWVVIQTAQPQAARPGGGAAGLDTAFVVARADQPSVLSVSRYGLSGKTTRIQLKDPQLAGERPAWHGGEANFQIVRETNVFSHSEKLTLAEEPIEEPVGPAVNNRDADLIELDGFYEGIEAGRLISISGERQDLKGVVVTEVSGVGGVTHRLNQQLPGDTLHTFIKLLAPLRYTYRRATVRINANVARATHGEIKKEVLGSGAATRSFQTLFLSSKPLTYLSAPTVTGIESTLEVRVNDVLWEATSALDQETAGARTYVTRIADDGSVRITFGDGRHGARLPSGVENIRAQYRAGIGKGGNLAAGRLSMLGAPPLGVVAAINPLASIGGADPEGRDSARRNAPLGVMALDRLVAVRDFADFARTYAGVSKASAIKNAGTVYVTIAGYNDIPIAPDSDLYRNLLQSMRRFGDPHVRIELATRRLMLLILSSDVGIDPAWEWKRVKPKLISALLAAFGFDQQELGQSIALSKVVSVMHQVPGVRFVDVNGFGGISEELETSKITERVQQLEAPGEPAKANLRVEPARVEGGEFHPAQLAYFTPLVSETLILEQALKVGNE